MLELVVHLRLLPLLCPCLLPLPRRLRIPFYDSPSLLTSNTDGLLYPSHPPTSEQVFTTVHTEFGHCANEQYRTVSQHKPGTLPVLHVDQDPPYYILLSTYISYLILICLGHVRDFVGKRFHPSSYHHLMPRDVSNSLSPWVSLF